MSRLEKIYSTIIKYGVYIILFTPLLVNKQFFFPYIFGKTIIIRSVVEILAVVYILLVLHNPGFKPRYSPLFWGVVVFMGIQVLSTIFGVNIYHSFWSNYERMEGLLTLLHFGVLFVILTGVLKKKEDWHQLLRVAVIASFLVALYGLGQKLGISGLMNVGVTKIDSTIGNSSYVAAYLVMNFFLAVYLFIRDKNLFWRIFYGIVLLGDVIVIFLTASRGGFGALLGGLLLMAFLVLFFSPMTAKSLQFKIIAGSFIILIFSFCLAVYLSRESSWVKDNYYLNKFSSISFENATMRDRLINWRIGFLGWKDRPLLGYGPENYYVPFNKYYNSRTSEPWFDRAHNIVFDQLNSNGIFGFFSYLFILLASLYYLWKKRAQDFWFFALFSILIMSYFFTNFFVFDNSNTYTVFFLLLAFISFMIFEKERDESRGQVISRKPVSIFVPMGLLLLLVVSLYFFNIRPAIANNLAIEAYKYSRVDYAKSLKLFQKALAYNTFGGPEIRLRIGDWALYLLDEYGEDRKETKEALDFAIQETKASIKKDEPLNARYYLYLGGLYNAAAQIDDREKNLQKAFEVLNEARRLSPERIDVYFQLGQTAFSAGDKGTAVRNFEKAFQIKADDKDTQLNLMLAYIYASDDQKTDKQFETLKDFGLRNFGDQQIQKLANVLSSSRDFDKAAQTLEIYLNNRPSAELYAKLAAIYLELGNKEGARQATLKAVELKPDFKAEADVFLKKLEGE